MKLLPLFPLILLAWQPALHGQGVAQEQQGNVALADGLWEVAELHFRLSLADPSLTPEAKSQVAIRLAESLIRAGNSDSGLELLGQSFVAKNPETPFWKAQALAGKNRFAEAIGIFTTLLADRAAPHRTEAGFSQASLQLALGQPDAALETLSQLMAESDAVTVAKIQLYQVEILLDLGRIAEAREAMPDSEAIATDDRPLAEFLEAGLLLKEGHAAEAQASFQELLNHSDGLSLTRFHSVAIGLAETIAAQGDVEGAALSLLAFLQKEFAKTHPEFPLLEPMFQRIIGWLPAKPALTDPILEALGSDLPDPARRETRWIAPAVFPATLPFDATRPEAVAAWPVYTPTSETSDISAFAMYARAIGVHRIGTPKSVAEARHLMNRLLLEYPGHLLADRALYQLARWALDEGNVGQAFSLLNTLRDTSKSPSLKGEATFLEARTASLNGDPKLAVQLFDEAAATLSGPQARTARMQAAIARLRGGDFVGSPGTELEFAL